MADQVPGLSVEDFAALRAGKQPYTLLDVREPWEVALVKLPEAITVPMRKVPDRLDLVPADRPVVVMCHRGSRSSRITAWLRSRGYDNAVNLVGGIDAWARTVDPTIATY